MRSVVCLLLVFLLSSCYNQVRHTPDEWEGYNFIVTADSIRLVCQQPDELPFDSVVVYNDDNIVVADIMTLPMDTVDSVWVKVARDQSTQGWIHESELLPGVSPDDPISRFIDIFSDVHLLIFLAFVVVVFGIYGLRKLSRRNAYIVHFRDISSFYPSLLAILVATSAVFYATIQMFAEESWKLFYYHPTLNPFSLPLHLGLFIISVWAIIIIAIATVEDTFKRLNAAEAVLYLCGLGAVCAVNYVFYTIATLYYIGYPCLLFYVLFALRHYFKHSHSRYRCGSCGSELTHKGACPSCGAINE